MIDEFHKLARRAEPIAARRTLGHRATDCKQQEGITRKDAADGTPYLFVSRSGKDPGIVCFVGNCLATSKRANIVPPLRGLSSSFHKPRAHA